MPPYLTEAGICRAVPFGRGAQDKKKRTHAVR
jgi:hypothetical protein